MDLSEYKKLFNSDEATPGWDAINTGLDALYKDQKPQH